MALVALTLAGRELGLVHALLADIAHDLIQVIEEQGMTEIGTGETEIEKEIETGKEITGIEITETVTEKEITKGIGRNEKRDIEMKNVQGREQKKPCLILKVQILLCILTI